MKAAPFPAPHTDADGAALRHLATLPVAEALAALASSDQGLTTAQADAARARFGPNRVAEAPAHGVLRQLLARLFNPLHLLLLTLAAVSLMTGNAESALIILLIMGLSVTLAFLQERRSDQAAAALRAMVHTQATVLRRPADGAAATPQELPIEQLVPGDVVHLSAGDLVPADLRLLSARDFFVNEASLTGESLPVEKHAGPAVADGQADTLALPNVCFMGTHVASGSATAMVVHTGSHAVFGAIADTMAATSGDSSFDQGVRRFTWLMLRFMAVMVPLVFIVNGLSKGDWLEALLFATAVAVGLTPEMLPMLVTVNLARGAMKMSRRKVIVKHLPAIQDVGAMDVLCTDKTGTLTQDRVILEKYIDLDGQPSDWVLDFAYLNSCYQSGLKSQLDQAVLRYTEVHARLHEGGAYQKMDELPFDFQRRRMSVLVAGQGQHLLICKGAVDEVFAVCTQAESGGRRFPLDVSHLPQAREVSRALNEDGFRVIAIAYKPLPAGHPPLTLADESDLVLLGFIAFLDPPKEGVREALAALARDGVAVKILTGDNEVVTRKICRDVALPVDKVLLGPAIEAMSDVQLGLEVDGTQVFARLTPAQKARVIEVLRRRGHVVGYLGDGINDGPALKAAHVGVSVDTAVDIAKESADIILLEKSLLVLHDGVIEGRRVFANLLKYVRMGASSSFGNMLSMLGASLWLPFLPMAPIQVLANNLLYDLSQTAIPTDHVDREELTHPRRWELDHIARFMLTMGPVSSLFDYATFAVLYFAFHASTPEKAALFHTGWFLESLLSQTLVIHVIRTRRLPFVHSRASWPLTAATLGVCAVGLWLPWSPLAGALGLQAMPAAYGPVLLALLCAYLALSAAAIRWWVRGHFAHLAHTRP